MRQSTRGVIAVTLLAGGALLGAATAFAAYRTAGSPPTADQPQPPQSRHRG